MVSSIANQVIPNFGLLICIQYSENGKWMDSYRCIS